MNSPSKDNSNNSAKKQNRLFGIISSVGLVLVLLTIFLTSKWMKYSFAYQFWLMVVGAGFLIVVLALTFVSFFLFQKYIHIGILFTYISMAALSFFLRTSQQVFFNVQKDYKRDELKPKRKIFVIINNKGKIEGTGAIYKKEAFDEKIKVEFKAYKDSTSKPTYTFDFTSFVGNESDAEEVIKRLKDINYTTLAKEAVIYINTKYNEANIKDKYADSFGDDAFVKAYKDNTGQELKLN